MSDLSDQLLTAEELAERWKLAVSQVYRLARDGHIDCVQLGKRQAAAGEAPPLRLDAAQVAEHLRITPEAVRAMVRAGRK